VLSSPHTHCFSIHNCQADSAGPEESGIHTEPPDAERPAAIRDLWAPGSIAIGLDPRMSRTAPKKKTRFGVLAVVADGCPPTGSSASPDSCKTSKFRLVRTTGCCCCRKKELGPLSRQVRHILVNFSLLGQPSKNSNRIGAKIRSSTYIGDTLRWFVCRPMWMADDGRV
jgi:hypothetical protein